jgi:hypothetical protein
MINFPSVWKDRLIFFGWIAGLIVAASLLWSLTFSFRANLLLRSVNKVLISMDDQRQVIATLPRQFPGPLGCWFRMAESDAPFFVFAIMKDGILVICGAEIDGEGKVKEIIPLGRHARKVIDRIPQGQIQVYTRRIEAAFAAGKEDTDVGS